MYLQFDLVTIWILSTIPRNSGIRLSTMIFIILFWASPYTLSMSVNDFDDMAKDDPVMDKTDTELLGDLDALLNGV